MENNTVGGAGTSFAERVAQKDCEIVLLAGEDSAPPKKRSVAEASEGGVQVVDKPANTKKTKWPPKSTKSWSAVIVIRCFGAMRHTNLTAVLKSKPL